MHNRRDSTAHALDCAGVGVEITADDPAVAEFVVEFFDPWFRPAQRRPEWRISVSTNPSEYRALRENWPVDAAPRPCFVHDQRVLSLPARTCGAGVEVCDAERSCFLRVGPGHLHVIADARTRRWRFTLLWILQEIAATRLRQTHVDLHAAATAHAGRAVAIAGAKNAGKTTLSFHLMRAGWNSIANDRSFVGRDGATFVVAGMPTAVKVRPPTLVRFPELADDFPPLARPYLYSSAELATAEPSAETVEDVGFLALTPWQIARRLGTTLQAAAPLGAIVFPEIHEDEDAWSLAPLSGDEVAAAIDGNLYGAAGGERPPTLFEELGGGRRAAVSAQVAAIGAGVAGYRLRLGRCAYDGGELERQLRQMLAG